MKEREAYKGVDYFRVFAAILVIAVHTSPLASYNETADFILTRIIARIAVPFFFMTSGFFLFSGYGYSEKLKRFISKTACLYALSIAVYIPVNIYSGYFAADYLLPKIIKDIIFDGTLYHLWYFPAAIMGAFISWCLIKKFGYKPAIGIAAILYVIGLFGDSYYGIAEQFPVLKSFYSNIFQICDYTRNGIFFAPVFFVLGGLTAKKAKSGSPVIPLAPFIFSFFLLFAEGLILRWQGIQRHDSMYIMLIPCMYCLFSWLLCFNGTIKFPLRTVSSAIYIIHPLMIIVIRMLAKISGMQLYLIDNSLIHYLAVLCSSMAAAVLFAVLKEHFNAKRRSKLSTAPKDRAWLEINLNNLKHNAAALQEAAPDKCELMAVVKAEAYGHGGAAVSECLNSIGVNAFAVATIEEGIYLRKRGISGDILIMGYTHPSRAKELRKYRLAQTVVDYDHALHLNEMGRGIKVHIKVDTGMHRLGICAKDLSQIEQVFRMKHLNVTGVYTHLCVSDSRTEDDAAFTQKQIGIFYELLEELKRQNITLPKIHVQSSYGLLNYPSLQCDYIRAGISLYGTLSRLHDETDLQLALLPVLSLKSRIALIRDIETGECVGYDRAFVSDRKTRVAVLPVGYADGIPRSLSCGGGNVIIKGKLAPVIGRICMDQLMVDVTDISDASADDIATLIGKDRECEIQIADFAENANSITNEVLSRMGRRLIGVYY